MMTPSASERGRGERWIKGIAFVATGAALLATSPNPQPTIELEKSVPAFVTNLDNGHPKSRVTFVVSSRVPSTDELFVDTAHLALEFSAIHDSQATAEEGNTPWLWVEVMDGKEDGSLEDPSSGQAGSNGWGGTTGEEQVATGPNAFLLSGRAFSTLALNEAGQAQLTFILHRAKTSHDYLPQVTWDAFLTEHIPSNENDTLELPWNVEVRQEDVP